MESLLVIVVILVVLSLGIWAIDLAPLPYVPKRILGVLVVVVTAIYILHRFVGAF